jgi:hypothetical protein
MELWVKCVGVVKSLAFKKIVVVGLMTLDCFETSLITPSTSKAQRDQVLHFPEPIFDAASIRMKEM